MHNELHIKDLLKVHKEIVSRYQDHLDRVFERSENIISFLKEQWATDPKNRVTNLEISFYSYMDKKANNVEWIPEIVLMFYDKRYRKPIYSTGKGLTESHYVWQYQFKNCLIPNSEKIFSIVNQFSKEMKKVLGVKLVLPKCNIIRAKDIKRIGCEFDFIEKHGKQYELLEHGTIRLKDSDHESLIVVGKNKSTGVIELWFSLTDYIANVKPIVPYNDTYGLLSFENLIEDPDCYIDIRTTAKDISESWRIASQSKAD